MDWNLVLFVIKWATIGLFYSVLLVLLFGVYREMSRSVPKEKPAILNGFSRLRVIAAGNDSSIPAGLTLELKPDNRLGAEKDNDIILRDSYVSAHHARLHWDGVAWWVEDLNSKNGTLVNHQRCAPGLPQSISNGSILSIGDMQLELVDQDVK